MSASTPSPARRTAIPTSGRTCRTARGIASYLRVEPVHGTIEIGHIWFGRPLGATAR